MTDPTMTGPTSDHDVSDGPGVAELLDVPVEAEPVVAEPAPAPEADGLPETAAPQPTSRLELAEADSAGRPDEPIAAQPVATPTGQPADAPLPDGLVPLQDLAPAIAEASMSRRVFLGFGLAVAGGLAGAAALSRFVPVFADAASVSPPPIVPVYDATTVAWTFVVDTSRCIGCGLCVAACKEENDVPKNPMLTRTWVERHATTTDGQTYVDSPDGGVDGFPPQSTAAGAEGKEVEEAFFVPRLCMQCKVSPCTSVCPVGATYRTPDGVILVDAKRCIGCGYCVVACPYGARYLVPAGEDAPNGTPGVADKCTWCYHRIARGLKPACVEVCPVGARRFGDANDPADEIASILAEQDPQPLNPEYGTQPRVLYLGPIVQEA